MMRYKLIYAKGFQKTFKKLDSSVQQLVASYIKHILENRDDPRKHGKAFDENQKGLWRYRIGQYRLLVDIQDHQIIILFLTFGY